MPPARPRAPHSSATATLTTSNGAATTASSAVSPTVERRPLRTLNALEWTAVEAVTNGLRAALQRSSSAQAELTSMQRRRAAVLAALDLDADVAYMIEPHEDGGATVFAERAGGA